jgi:Domain of unknown function (DUF4157)
MARTDVNTNSAGNGQTAASQGGGLPLPSTARRQMEMRFGQDFSSVRVHTAPNAAFRLHGLNAQAYTQGDNIHFKPGAYDPHSASGQNVLAHELANVVQQRAGVAIADGTSNVGPAAGAAAPAVNYGISAPAAAPVGPVVSGDNIAAPGHSLA